MTREEVISKKAILQELAILPIHREIGKRIILQCEEYETCTWKNCCDCNREKCIKRYVK